VLTDENLIYDLQKCCPLIQIHSQCTREIVVLARQFAEGFRTLIANALKFQSLGMDLLARELKGQSNVM
jgi:hypothetical protein